jgi:flagellar capping protein FliD
MKNENITITQLCKNIALSEPGARKNIESNKQDYIKQGYVIINETMKQGQKTEQIRVTQRGINYFMSKYPFKDIIQEEINQEEIQSGKEVVENDKYITILENTIKELKEENKRLNNKIDDYQEQQKQDREALTNQFNQLFETNRKLADNMQGLMEFMQNQPKQLTGDIIQEQPKQENIKKQGLFSRLFRRGEE